MSKVLENIPRVLLVHWKESEAAACAALLRGAGFEPVILQPDGMPSLRSLADDPPAAIVIDLDRLPSHGRAVATALRQQKGTRAIPLVFVAGIPEKVARIREAFPDANFSSWKKIGPALRTAIAAPPARPVVPETMSAYSGTPLPKKLGIKPGSVVLVLGAPPEFQNQLGPPPDGARFSRTARTANLILMFNRSRAEFERRLPGAASKMKDGGGLWIIWPKKASGVQTDLTQNIVRETGLAAGLVDYKICAVDETWSGLLFVRRRNKKSGEQRAKS